jgi:hypothetical protein
MLCEAIKRNKALKSSYGGDVKMWVEVERRLNLKEESSDLNLLEVAA